MANEFGPNLDRYPPEGGRFWLLTERSGREWVHTIRTKADWPLVGAMRIGIEVARLNSWVIGRHPGLDKAIVDALNREDCEPLNKIHKALSLSEQRSLRR